MSNQTPVFPATARALRKRAREHQQEYDGLCYEGGSRCIGEELVAHVVALSEEDIAPALAPVPAPAPTCAPPANARVLREQTARRAQGNTMMGKEYSSGVTGDGPADSAIAIVKHDSGFAPPPAHGEHAPSSSLQMASLRLLLHLQPPVRQHPRSVLRHTLPRQMLIASVVFRPGAASVVPPTRSTATAPCAATHALAPMDVSTLRSVMLLAMT